MKINKHNYEAFFLDYHEGNLTPQQVADLLLFIEQNPHLKDEFESFENVTLENFSFQFDNKEDLKKIITDQNKEEYFIRSVEGILNSAEKTLLDDFLKQHPQYLAELELFSKTKLHSDASVIFENKEVLKRIAVTNDDLLIASVEGLLTKDEDALLKKQISRDAAMKHDFYLLQQTKLVADTSIIFEGKEDLKRKERKIVPLFYYVAIAASVLLLFGLLFIFNNNQTEQKLADQKGTDSKQIEKSSEKQNTESKVQKVKADNSLALNGAKSKKAKGKQNKIKKAVNTLKKEQQPSINIAENNIHNNNIETPNQIQTPQIKELPAANSAIAQVEKKNQPVKETEFLSLREVVAAKIKEKTLDADVLAAEKKTDKLKKVSGWDVVQILAKGASKLTGKKVEVKPTYNNEGEVTAYALAAGGFQFSKGK